MILLSVCNGIVKVLVRFSLVDKLFCKIYFFVFFMVFDFWSDLSEDFNLWLYIFCNDIVIGWLLIRVWNMIGERKWGVGFLWISDIVIISFVMK